MSAEHGETLSERSQIHWISRSAFQFIVILLILNLLAIGVAVHAEKLWLATILVLTGSHLMHGALIGFHEASHGLLRRSRWLNEFDGVVIGTLSLVSFSLYRVLHQWHHVHLSTPKDEEFWPFVQPDAPRWLRVLIAVSELTCGLFVAPLIFFRCFVRKGSTIRNKRVRRRIWREYALIAGFWVTVLSAVAWFGVWKYFLWMHFAPAFVAANLQSWRKYIEHVGMTGSTINGSTRSIVSKGPLGRLISLTLLHEPYHGVHHRHGSLPHPELPGHAEVLQPSAPGERPPFASYGHALIHLAGKLSDPRIGAQWNERRTSQAGAESQEELAPSA
jgi:fatty acid desaturase